MCATQSISFFDRFWPAVSSLIVALILFLIGFLVNRRAQKKEQEKRYVSVLRSIHYDFKKNLDLLCQLHAYLFVKVLPSFSLELSRKDALVQTLIPLCLNFRLLDRISDGYFELVHIQRRLDQLQQSRGAPQFDGNLLLTYTLINNDIRAVFEILSEIIGEIRVRDYKPKDILHFSEDYLKQKFDEFQNAPDIIEIAKQRGIDLSKRHRFYYERVTPETPASGSAPPWI